MKFVVVMALIAAMVVPATGHAEPRGFVHPGVAVSKPQLDFVKWRLARGAEPWTTAFAATKASPLASLSYVPRPRPIVECGFYSTPNNGCTEERDDAMAAYTHALLWYFTNDRGHADKAIEIMDAWARVIVDHTNSNAPLQSAWAASSFARAGELVRHTYDGWDREKQDRFSSMLRFVYLPKIINGEVKQNGNWELIMMGATAGVAVFLDDRPVFDRALAITRGRVPAYIYLAGDGPQPRSAPGSSHATREQLVEYWHGQATFSDGVSQETCRDLGHTGWGFAAAVHTAEIARIQRVDLYRELQPRLTKALEFHGQFDLGVPVPEWLCGGALKRNLGPVLEIAYNHYGHRKGIPLPNTKRLVEAKRPVGRDQWLGWETLTHASNPF